MFIWNWINSLEMGFYFTTRSAVQLFTAAEGFPPLRLSKLLQAAVSFFPLCMRHLKRLCFTAPAGWWYWRKHQSTIHVTRQQALITSYFYTTMANSKLLSELFTVQTSPLFPLKRPQHQQKPLVLLTHSLVNLLPHSTQKPITCTSAWKIITTAII